MSILSSLKASERAKVADVLEARTFNEGENVLIEGEEGDEFFLIESGSAEAIKNMNGVPTVVKKMSVGDYFGGEYSHGKLIVPSLTPCPELALLNRQTRAATVRASSKLRVVALGEQAFTRLLGPAKDIMARNAGERYGYAVGR